MVRPRITLRWMLLLVIPLAALLAVYGNNYRQRLRAIRAYQAICDKGVDAHFHTGTDHTIFFKNGNVTDEDLSTFLPAFGKQARDAGIGRITGLRLNGSKVSPEAISNFHRLNPDCTIDP